VDSEQQHLGSVFTILTNKNKYQVNKNILHPELNILLMCAKNLFESWALSDLITVGFTLSSRFKHKINKHI
jgi:hypothetical protein